MKRIDLIGKRFGRLLVLSELPERKNKLILWKCLCDCGKTLNVFGINLTRCHTASCGCLQKEQARERVFSHGMIQTRQYKIWAGMKNRCQNPKNSSYELYGEKGIALCGRWQKFENFWEDMKDGYADNLSIDRVDNDKGYYKENCRWATQKQQQNNRGNNHLVSFNGETKTLKQWAESIGINYRILSNRINTYNWSIEKALTTPKFR